MIRVNVPNKSKAAKTRNLGSKRCCRFSISVTSNTENKLDALAISTGFTRSELCDYLLQICVNSPDLVNSIQDKFNKNERYRVHPRIINDGEKQVVIY